MVFLPEDFADDAWRQTGALSLVDGDAAAEVGIEGLRGVAVGGGSDGNFTAAAGVATLDGLGAVGGGAHADHEWVDVATLIPRSQLLTSLVRQIVAL